ncbi:MAG: hypothetical protein ACYC3B_03010 [Sedimentisphaerales bacterium]
MKNILAKPKEEKVVERTKVAIEEFRMASKKWERIMELFGEWVCDSHPPKPNKLVDIACMALNTNENITYFEMGAIVSSKSLKTFVDWLSWFLKNEKIKKGKNKNIRSNKNEK